MCGGGVWVRGWEVEGMLHGGLGSAGSKEEGEQTGTEAEMCSGTWASKKLLSRAGHEWVVRLCGFYAI